MSQPKPIQFSSSLERLRLIRQKNKQTAGAIADAKAQVERLDAFLAAGQREYARKYGTLEKLEKALFDSLTQRKSPRLKVVR